MDHIAASPVAVVISFIDRINRGDADGLGELMAEDYVLTVFDEAPQPGREAGIEGWRGYAAAFPRYLVLPHRIALVGDTVAVVGHTTGSHLGLPDEEESKLTLIWLGVVRDGLVARWTLIEDTPESRARWQLD
jgi:ketosteroid isomerase-like protein